jgi:hypothetical protein
MGSLEQLLLMTLSMAVDRNCASGRTRAFGFILKN